jgi:hypothetical protein
MYNSLPYPPSFANPIADPFAAPYREPLIQKSKPVPAEAGTPRFLNYAGDYSGCGAYRLLWPEYLINMSGLGMSNTITSMILDPRWYAGVKSVKFQRQASPEQKEFMKYVRQISAEHGFKMITRLTMLSLERIFLTITDLNLLSTPMKFVTTASI